MLDPLAKDLLSFALQREKKLFGFTIPCSKRYEHWDGGDEVERTIVFSELQAWLTEELDFASILVYEFI